MYVYVCVCIVAFANQTLSAASLPDKQNCVNGLPIEQSQRSSRGSGSGSAAAVGGFD